MNNPAKDLFDTVIKQGIVYVDDLVANKVSENYYLDFKLTENEDYTGKRNLFDSDKKNYGKCISAFGNSEGGVIIWGIETGASDTDYAIGKKAIKNVSNFCSLLESFTSLLTSPPHPNVSNKIIFEDETNDTGYVVSYIPKSNRRPFQVLNKDLRYYIRAGSSSQPAPDTFLRALFGQEPQPNAFIVYGTPPIEVDHENTIKIKLGIIIHNKGENVAKNLNGYVYVGGESMAIEISQSTQNDFAFNKNSISGMKIGFVAKPHFILGIEQEVCPLTIHLELKKELTEHGILIETLVNCDNQQTYRFSKRLEKAQLQDIYKKYITDQNFNIIEAIIGKGEEE
ncbi:MAG: ATP-binding protein [bacterium]